MATRPFAYIVAITLTAFVASAQEPVKPPVTPRIITATKQVSLFSGLEKQLLQAVQKKDKAALQSLLSEDFILEMPDADPLDIDGWLDSVTTKDYALKSFMIRQMSAIDLGNAVLVKFERIQEASSKGQPDGGEFFVVDLWKKDGDNWKLANRYVSKVSSRPTMPKASGQAHRKAVIRSGLLLPARRASARHLLSRRRSPHSIASRSAASC